MACWWHDQPGRDVQGSVRVGQGWRLLRDALKLKPSHEVGAHFCAEQIAAGRFVLCRCADAT